MNHIRHNRWYEIVEQIEVQKLQMVTYLEWDYQHGEVEIYDKQRRHKGSKKPYGSNPKPAVPDRKTRK